MVARMSAALAAATLIAGLAGNALADATADAGKPPVIDLRAVGKTFEGPHEIPSGWTTFRFTNASPMIHFAIFDKPPAGITVEQMSEQLMTPFQVMMDAMNAGDDEAAKAALATFPDWVGNLGRFGGPGLLSPGLVGETTVNLPPGYYVVECYVKTDGVFHSTSPGKGKLGMVMPLTVTNENNGASEPDYDATLTIKNSGYEMDEGALQPGHNTIRVEYAEQQALPTFVGNDVHLMRVDNPESIALADAWMDWSTRDGLQSPSPVTFLGGVEDLPAGSYGYFSVDLAPGNYAFIGEMPAPLAAGFVLPVTVEESAAPVGD